MEKRERREEKVKTGKKKRVVGKQDRGDRKHLWMMGREIRDDTEKKEAWEREKGRTWGKEEKL